jgi:hypothetical protein
MTLSPGERGERSWQRQINTRAPPTIRAAGLWWALPAAAVTST